MGTGGKRGRGRKGAHGGREWARLRTQKCLERQEGPMKMALFAAKISAEDRVSKRKAVSRAAHGI